MPVRFDAWSAATWTALWTRPWSKHSGGDRVPGRSLRRSVDGFLVQEEVKRLAGIAAIFPPATLLGRLLEARCEIPRASTSKETKSPFRGFMERERGDSNPALYPRDPVTKRAVEARTVPLWRG